MNYFVEKLKVPSAAVDAMILGLKHQDSRPDYFIKMDSFGDEKGG